MSFTEFLNCFYDFQTLMLEKKYVVTICRRKKKIENFKCYKLALKNLNSLKIASRLVIFNINSIL